MNGWDGVTYGDEHFLKNPDRWEPDGAWFAGSSVRTVWCFNILRTVVSIRERHGYLFPR